MAERGASTRTSLYLYSSYLIHLSLHLFAPFAALNFLERHVRTQTDGLRAALVHERSKEAQTFEWISKKMNASLKVLETLSADVNTRVRKANKDAAREISELTSVAKRMREARLRALEVVDAHSSGESTQAPKRQAVVSAQIYKSEFEQLFEVFSASETCTKLRSASKLYSSLAS